MAYTAEQSLAIEAVARAARLCEAVRAEMADQEALAKSDRSPVTVADFGAQALVCRSLLAFRPDAVIVAEEDSTAIRSPENSGTLDRVTAYVGRWARGASAEDVCRWIDAGNGSVGGRFWTLDPIDGTKGYLRGEQYAVALALIEHGEVQVAALACPALPVCMTDPAGARGVLFAAVRGEGASAAPLESADFAAVHVAPAGEVARWRLVESVEQAHGDAALQERVARAAGLGQPPLRLDSQAKYGALARGDAALYLRFPARSSSGYREKIWDHAAGALIVTEAGGRVTNMRGKRLDFARSDELVAGGGIVASNGACHESVLRTLASFG